MKKISSKIILSVVGVILFVAILLGSTSTIIMSQINENRLTQLEEMMYEDYDNLIKTLVLSLTTQLDGIAEDIDNGLISDIEGKAIAANMIRNSKYGDNGYFWVDDYAGNNVALYGNKSVEGKNRLQLTDSNGKRIIEEFIKIAKAGGGFADYYFPKKGETESLRKRAYIMAYDRFQWVIGTGNYIDDIDSFINKERAEALEHLHKIRLTLLSIIIASVIIGYALSLIVGKKISKPIVALTKLIDITSDLDISDNKEYDYLATYKDETGNIAKSIFSLRERLREVISGLHDDSLKLDSSSDELHTIANQGQESMVSVNETANEFAQGATEQAENAQEASESMITLSQEIDESIASSKKLMIAAQDVDSNSKNGGRLIRELGSTFEQTVKTIHDLDSNVQELSIKSTSIGTITTAIQSIAEQTNLLALNAAIEAARAGESGKGFAVVADEIRKLAEQTSQSTEQINSIVSEILSEIALTQKNMNESNEVVSVSEVVMADVQQAFVSIEDSMVTTMEQLEQIILSMNLVGDTKNSVTSAIQDISAITEENAAASEEISATMDTQVQQMRNILDNVGDVNGIIQRLNGIIGEFKL